MQMHMTNPGIRQSAWTKVVQDGRFSGIWLILDENRPTDSSQETILRRRIAPSRYEFGTVKSFIRFLHRGYITVDGLNVDVPFQTHY